MTSEHARARQCKACPWKVGVKPSGDIPGGYSEAKHRALDRTIAEPGSTADLGKPLHVMACHETPPGRELMCAGWVHNQLGPGNNIALRMKALDGRFHGLRVDGPQHERFEDTLPK